MSTGASMSPFSSLLSARAVNEIDAASGDVTVLWRWTSYEHLLRIDAEASGPYLLIEADDEAICAVSPVLGRGGALCLPCYLGRRRANGATECRPLADHSSIEGPAAIVRSEILRFKGGSRVGREVVLEKDGRVTQHIALPTPGCARCAGQTPPPGSLTLLDAISSRLGIVHNVERTADDRGPLVHLTARGSRTDAFHTTRAYNHGAATAATYEDARIRCVAEALERYCAAFSPPATPVVAARDLDGLAIRPEQIERQIGQGERVRWARARRMRDHAPVWVPVSSLCLPYQGDDEDLHPAFQSSNGLAAGPSLFQAQAAALRELVERDVLMRAWSAQSTVERVPFRPFNLPGLVLLRVPAPINQHLVVAFLEADEPPYTATGSALGSTIEAAATAAALEAEANRAWLAGRIARGSGLDLSLPPRTLDAHAVTHALLQELRNVRRHWLETAHQTTMDAPSGGMSLLSYAPEACFIEMTTPDVAALGVRVVRAVCPGLVPFDHDGAAPRLGNPALPHPFA